MVPDNEAEGRLAEVYDMLTGKGKRPVAHILKISSVNPGALEGHLTFYKSLRWAKGPLSGARREMIATVVSAVNECHY